MIWRLSGTTLPDLPLSTSSLPNTIEFPSTWQSSAPYSLMIDNYFLYKYGIGEESEKGSHLGHVEITTSLDFQLPVSRRHEKEARNRLHNVGA